MRDNATDEFPATCDPLPGLPLLEVGSPASLALIDAAPDRLDALLANGRRHYGDWMLKIGDEITRRWLERSNNPYRFEIDAVRGRLTHPGAVMLNMSYEWSCTAGVGADPSGVGNRLLRTLDWPLPGLGRSAVVAHQSGACGSYFAVTWPGYVGVLTAMAPGRFSASINQPPLRRQIGATAADWVVGRVRLWRTHALPPSHLLRRVFDTCRTYGEALRLITEAPLCLPAFFSLSGVNPDEGCVIERLENGAIVHRGMSCIANHWIGFMVDGYDRGNDSPGRLSALRRLLPRASDGFDWVIPPILNRCTRLAVVANAARGLLYVRGYEQQQPATATFSLSASD
jgi:hypothetical protein